MKPGADYPATLADLAKLKTAMPLIHNGQPFRTIGQELAAIFAEIDDPKRKPKDGRKRQDRIRDHHQRPDSTV